jgi:cytochrome c-type biogenesis protein CcmH/NrfG
MEIGNLAYLWSSYCCRVGEAWANIGAVQMKLKNWSRAYDALQEAQKHKPREWRIIENLMMATLEMRR